jgi:hypothetical protein
VVGHRYYKVLSGKHAGEIVGPNARLAVRSIAASVPQEVKVLPRREDPVAASGIGTGSESRPGFLENCVHVSGNSLPIPIPLLNPWISQPHHPNFPLCLRINSPINQIPLNRRKTRGWAPRRMMRRWCEARPARRLPKDQSAGILARASWP